MLLPWWPTDRCELFVVTISCKVEELVDPFGCDLVGMCLFEVWFVIFCGVDIIDVFVVFSEASSGDITNVGVVNNGS